MPQGSTQPMRTPETLEPSDSLPASDDDTFEVIDGQNLGDEHDVIALISSLINQAERFLPEQVTTAPHQRNQLGTDRLPARDQRHRSTPALRPRLTHRRQPMALQLLTPNKKRTYLHRSIDKLRTCFPSHQPTTPRPVPAPAPVPAPEPAPDQTRTRYPAPKRIRATVERVLVVVRVGPAGSGREGVRPV